MFNVILYYDNIKQLLNAYYIVIQCFMFFTCISFFKIKISRKRNGKERRHLFYDVVRKIWKKKKLY